MVKAVKSLCCSLELTIFLSLLYTQAVQNMKEDIILVLLQHKANPNLKDINGETALHHAVYSGIPEIVARLLEFGSNIEDTTKVKTI